MRRGRSLWLPVGPPPHPHPHTPYLPIGPLAARPAWRPRLTARASLLPPHRSATGTTTNGLIGAASCAWVLPGYSYSNGSATECPADTFANATRLTLDAKGCAPCPSGTTTFGLAGQAACLDAAGLVPPGKFKSGSDVLPCPPGT